MLKRRGFVLVYLCSRNNGVWLLGKGLKACSSKLAKSVAAAAAAVAAAVAGLADSLVGVGWSDVVVSVLFVVLSVAESAFGSTLILANNAKYEFKNIWICSAYY